MRTYACVCGNRLFFHNTNCLKCGAETTLCHACRHVVPIVIDKQNGSRCGNARCNALLESCANRNPYGICNGSVPGGNDHDAARKQVANRIDGHRLVDHGTAENPGTLRLCRFCELTTVIPDTSSDQNLLKWRRLEGAKRRVLYTLEQSGFPLQNPLLIPASIHVPNGIATANESQSQSQSQESIASRDIKPRLEFQFKADGEHRVTTGHDQGCIVINIDEADSIQRERTRVQFGELQRTLVGHFRHELGHYYWDLLVKPHRLVEFRGLFGDETNPDYATAQKAYYETGPKPNWREAHVSGYATMHPWEDFAETFGTYLDLVTIVDTAKHFGLVSHSIDTLPELLVEYQTIGIRANEFNRDMGLLDLVPEVFNDVIQHKLQFVHDLRQVVALTHARGPVGTSVALVESTTEPAVESSQEPSI